MESDSSGDAISGGQGQEDFVAKTWIRATVEAYVLQEMIERDQNGAVVENIRNFYDGYDDPIGGPFDAYQILLDSGVLIETNSNHEVETDSDKWIRDGGDGVGSGEVRQALSDAITANQVDWCGGSVSGNAFADDYVDANEDLYDTTEEYEASMEDFVNCGSE